MIEMHNILYIPGEMSPLPRNMSQQNQSLYLSKKRKRTVESNLDAGTALCPPSEEEGWGPYTYLCVR